MSASKLEEIQCPCGEIFEAELYNSINATKDPELKEALLAGEINVVCCPSCNEMFYAEHFLIYHDIQNEFMAFVYPKSFVTEMEYWHSKMIDDFEKAMKNLENNNKVNYKPIAIFGLDNLVSLIHEEDEKRDEAAILKYLGEDLGLDVINLHPCIARQQRLPYVLPLARSQTGSFRDKLILGLKTLLIRNDHLTLYKELLADVERNKGWKLEEGEVIPIKKKKKTKKKK